MKIHSSSIISKDAEIADGVEIGPFCVISGKVKIGPGNKFVAHVVVGTEEGIVEIGKNNVFGAGAVVGGHPQDLKYNGEATKLIIGDHNRIRELTTLNIGTVTGTGATTMGDHNLMMAYAHLGHDCKIGSHTVIGNSGQLAGHVTIEDHAKLGGVCAINQFSVVGQHSFIAGCSVINKDILPFTMAQGHYAVCRATNRIGMERGGFAKEDIDSVNRAIRIITKGNHTMEEAIERIGRECAPCGALTSLTDFIRKSERGVAI